MTMRKSGVFGIALCGLVFLSGAMSGQTSASGSSAQTGSMGAEVRVSVGVFVVESGARLALEIVRDDPCTCLCDPVHVTGLSLLDGSGETVQSEIYEPSIDTAEWLGRVALVDDDGVVLPEGPYSVLVETTAGAFSASVEIVPTHQMAQSGRFSASASVCGLELRVYRLITEEDAGASVALRQGDRLMVALAGNATTGFQWENVLLYEYAVLPETQEMEYREEPHPETMVGSGGTFLFRYEAVAPGAQSFRFVYHRPWESVEPAQVVEFTAIVY